MKLQLLIAVALFSCSITWSQNATEDFVKINAFYMKNAIQADVAFKVYDSWTSNQVLQEKKGALKRWKGYQYYEIDNMQTITTPNAYLAVDDNAKSIFLSSRKEQQDQITEMDLEKQLPSLLKLCKKVQYNKEQNSMASYTLFYKGNTFDKIKIYFHQDKFYITKMEIYSSLQDGKEVVEGNLKKPRIEIVYNQVKIVKNFSEKDFAFNRYLQQKDGSWKKTTSYQQYTLIDQLSPKR